MNSKEFVAAQATASFCKRFLLQKNALAEALAFNYKITCKLTQPIHSLAYINRSDFNMSYTSNPGNLSKKSFNRSRSESPEVSVSKNLNFLKIFDFN